MRGTDKFELPVGEIGMYMHKGGIWLPQENKLSDDAEILDSREMKNLIVSKASTLMAARLAPGNTINGLTGNWLASGLQYLAVGTGVGTGTTQAPQGESASQTALRSELARKQFTSWTYLDASDNASASETNKLQLVTTFLEAEAVGAIVEMGLFGGNASGSTGSGFMFNYKTFAVWNKPNDARLTITWKLTF